MAEEMEPYDVAFHEQPVAGYETLATVAHRIKSPVMADESAWVPQDVLRLHELGAARLYPCTSPSPAVSIQHCRWLPLQMHVALRTISAAPSKWVSV